MTKSGIYAIIHHISGRRYIGSAKDTRKRWHRHLCVLRKGKHENSHLQRMWDKYGESSFSFAILEADIPVDKLIEREQHWIDAADWPLFNARRVADSNLGVAHTEESKMKMSRAARVRKKISDETRAKMAAARAKLNTMMAHRDRVSEEWVLTSPKGEEVVVKNLAEWCKANGLSQFKLYLVAANKRSHHKGWKAKKNGWIMRSRDHDEPATDTEASEGLNRLLAA